MTRGSIDDNAINLSEEALVELHRRYDGTRLGRVAARELLDRGYGRPTQTTELRMLTLDLFDQAIQDLETQLAANDSDRPSRTAGEDSALPAATRTA
jgi:phage terminase large subunit-like protein